MSPTPPLTAASDLIDRRRRFIEAVLDGLMVLLTGGVMLLYSPVLAAVSLLARAGEIKQPKRREKLIEFADQLKVERIGLRAVNRQGQDARPHAGRCAP